MEFLSFLDLAGQSRWEDGKTAPGIVGRIILQA